MLKRYTYWQLYNPVGMAIFHLLISGVLFFTLELESRSLSILGKPCTFTTTISLAPLVQPAC